MIHGCCLASFISFSFHLLPGERADGLRNLLVKSLAQVNSQYACFCLSLLPSGLPGTVCRAAQPTHPSRAVRLPAAQILHGAPVGLHTDMQHMILHTSKTSKIWLKNRYSYLFSSISIHLYFRKISFDSYELTSSHVVPPVCNLCLFTVWIVL